ncbi:MAG: isoprenylcysteine carboxylmethyltransferase family protein [Candidatus Omnitrophica bacterium]|nr:isoprenylcysteine carboxylmethyltransferase family protein [Candidatus Omnitrophota bacterium]
MRAPLLFLFFMAILGLRQITFLWLTNRNRKNKIFKKWIVYFIGISYLIIFLGTIGEFFLIRRNINFAVSFLGIFFCLLGIALQIWAFKSLGNNWSFYIEVGEETTLVTDEAYRYLRHPASLGFIFEGIGIPLVANTFFILIFSILVYLPLILWRIYIEEKVLIERFGKNYLEYKKTTPFLIKLRK